MTRHTLSVLVEDKPGVLTRVASLFARRAFNINSLAVGPTEVPGVSRMTVVVDADGDLIEQALAVNDRPVVIDFVVSRDSMVWPMVPSGVSNDEIQVARDMTPDWDEED